jgi:cytochrome P450
MVADPYFRPDVPAHIPASVVYDFNLYAPQHEALDPYRSFKRLHDIGLPDLFWTRHNGGHWVALRGDAIVEMMRDPGHFSSKRFLVPDEQNFQTDFFIPLMADPPEHTAYRRIAATAFSPQKILALEPKVRALTGSLVRDLRPHGGCEFMSEFSLQMPIIVFLGMMDLPIEDRPRLLDIANRIVRPQEETDQRDNALQSLLKYLDPLIGERRRDPGSDVISGLIQATSAGGRKLTEEEIMGMTATILIGGLDTVAATLGCFVRYLADDVEQRHRLVAEPNLIRVASEELFRRFAPTTNGRVVTADLNFRGHELKRNEHVMWAAGMYNLDDRIFADPLTVDFGRKRSPHLGFGHGIHFCLGSALAQMEFKVFLEEWLGNIRDFSVADGAKIEYRPGLTISYEQLPLVWPT